MNTLNVIVQRKVREADGIYSFKLVAADGASLPVAAAGAHVDVVLPGGLSRQYSLCNVPGETGYYEVGVLREPESRGGSAAMCDTVQEGDRLQVGEPRNLFPLVEAPFTLLFAGGIGITPLLAMGHTLHAQGKDFHLHYCVRSAARAAFAQRLQQAPWANRVSLHLDDGDAAQKLDMQACLKAAPAGTHLYVCGPGGFIDWVLGSAEAAGWPAEQRHVEYFQASPATAEAAQGEGFTVRLARSNLEIAVADGETVVNALARHDIHVDVSCEQGFCGTCVTRVLEGTPDHRDIFFTDDERARNDQFTPCCSRAKTAVLVLDL